MHACVIKALIVRYWKSTINMKNIKENKDWIKSRIYEFSLFNNSLTIYEQMLNLEDNITNWGKVCDLDFYDVYAK